MSQLRSAPLQSRWDLARAAVAERASQTPENYYEREYARDAARWQAEPHPLEVTWHHSRRGATPSEDIVKRELARLGWEYGGREEREEAGRVLIGRREGERELVSHTPEGLASLIAEANKRARVQLEEEARAAVMAVVKPVKPIKPVRPVKPVKPVKPEKVVPAKPGKIEPLRTARIGLSNPWHSWLIAQGSGRDSKEREGAPSVSETLERVLGVGRGRIEALENYAAKQGMKKRAPRKIETTDRPRSIPLAGEWASWLEARRDAAGDEDVADTLERVLKTTRSRIEALANYAGKGK